MHAFAEAWPDLELANHHRVKGCWKGLETLPAAPPDSDEPLQIAKAEQAKFLLL
jgi:hypothetical protein